MDEYLYKQKKFDEKLVLGDVGERFVEKYHRVLCDYLLGNKNYRLEYCKTASVKVYPYETNRYEQEIKKIDGLLKFINGIPYNVKTRQHGAWFFDDIYFQIGYQYFSKKDGKKYQVLDVDIKKNSFYYYDLILKNINIFYLFLDDEGENVQEGAGGAAEPVFLAALGGRHALVCALLVTFWIEVVN